MEIPGLSDGPATRLETLHPAYPARAKVRPPHPRFLTDRPSGSRLPRTVDRDLQRKVAHIRGGIPWKGYTETEHEQSQHAPDPMVREARPLTATQRAAIRKDTARKLPQDVESASAEVKRDVKVQREAFAAIRRRQRALTRAAKAAKAQPVKSAPVKVSPVKLTTVTIELDDDLPTVKRPPRKASRAKAKAVERTKLNVPSDAELSARLDAIMAKYL